MGAYGIFAAHSEEDPVTAGPQQAWVRVRHGGGAGHIRPGFA